MVDNPTLIPYNINKMSNYLNPLRKINIKSLFGKIRGQNISIPHEFIQKFVEIWNINHPKNKINEDLAILGITHLCHTVTAILDNGFDVFMHPVLYFKTWIQEKPLPLNRKDRVYKSRIYKVRWTEVMIMGRLMTDLRSLLNPNEEYQEFIAQKREVYELMKRKKFVERCKLRKLARYV